MSKAFVNDDATLPEPDGIPDRPETLPITAAGERTLRAALAVAAAQKDEAELRRARVLTRILETVYIPPPSPDHGQVVFGGQVEVEDQDGGVQRYRIVGPDEVHLQPLQISVGSPFARALLGKQVGDEVTVRRPKGDLELTILRLWPPEV
ncbi:MAG: GreA/GreB family elongation factor [Deltaproteobacteria bacterium]|nr:GreA/GreB family elongation factor [Deltaproteobacteria bacterium]